MNGPRALRVLAGVGVALVALAAGVHAYAYLQYRGSFPPAALPARVAAIRRAMAVEPWNRAFQAREDYVTAEDLLATGRLVPAYDLLHAAVYAFPDDADLDRLWRRVYRLWYDATAGKAHLQHGHEGPGGTLRPEDVER